MGTSIGVGKYMITENRVMMYIIYFICSKGGFARNNTGPGIFRPGNYALSVFFL